MSALAQEAASYISSYLRLPERGGESSPANSARNQTFLTALSPVETQTKHDYRPALRDGKAVFCWQFPNSAKKIPTPGDGLCGLHAIRGSLKAQAPGLPVPSIEELQAVLDQDNKDSRRIAESIRASKYLGNKMESDAFMNDRSWFLQDHLAAIFHLWGRSRGLDVALGIWTDCQGFKVHDSDFTGPKTQIIWVHHNNRNHYSGLRANLGS
ncbi:hypothetical protein F5Y09DRAFT_341051 [Xylaria sp. FL1042]|nr:hypothetical protein F5Y09DRAFT_341051 [Xylaria sp. FL1042]